MRQLYAGCDLHGNNNVIGIVDGEGKRIFKKRLSNELPLVRDTLGPFKEELIGIAVESTYNWYRADFYDLLEKQGIKTIDYKKFKIL